MAKVQGLDRLKRKMARLRAQTETDVEPALVKAGEVVAAEQRRLAPKKTGKLRDSIAVTTGAAAKYAAFQGSAADRKNRAVRISAGNSEVRYAHLVEFGTKPHKIKPKNREALKMGSDEFAIEADHPGAAAQPFFFPGYRATRKRARSIVGKAVRESVRKAVK